MDKKKRAEEKKYAWHYSEIPEDPEVSALMPGFDIQYMITQDTVDHNTNAVFGHCVFPPNAEHEKHLHTKAAEICYTIKGTITNSYYDENGNEVHNVCPAGTAAFAPINVVHWVHNDTDEPAEFVFAYFGCSDLNGSGYVDVTKKFQK
jgi:quercetin dioxygenase-like cupin family protein